MSSAAVKVQNLTKIFRHPLPWLGGLVRRLGQTEVTALKDVSLTIQQGEIFGLVGRNGQGKTTLVKSIAGLIEPTSGFIKVFGFDPTRHTLEVKKRMGLVTSDERSFYWRLTGWQNLIFFSRLHGIDKADARRRIAELLERFELKDLANRRFHEFSTGNRQRLAIVRALLTDPPLLLLDEPTRSLDPLAADELRRLVLEWVDSSQQKTVLITTHNLAEIEQLCGRVAILSRNTLKECASVAELRLKYSSRMDVILHIRRIATEDNLIQLQTKVPTLTWKNVPPDTMEVQFSKKPEDGTLDLVLNNLRRSGAEILDCHTVRRGLKEIMEEIEQEA